MSDVKRFETFLDQFAVKTRGNIQSLVNGKWLIPKDQRHLFFSLYHLAAPKKSYHFVYKAPNIEIQPFRMDIDFQNKQITSLNYDQAFSFAMEISKECFNGRNGFFYIVAKSLGYWTFLKSIDKDVYKTGFHIYFPYSTCDDLRCTKIRDFSVQIISKHFPNQYINGPDDIVDKRVTHKKNGLMLLGTFKPKFSSTGPYMMKVAYDPDKFKCERFDFTMAQNGFEPALLDKMYGFIFEDDDPSYIPPPER